MDNKFDYTVKFEGVTENKNMSPGETITYVYHALQEKGLEVVGLSTLAKLSEKAEKKFKNNSIDVSYLTDYDEILDVATEEKIINNKEKIKMLRFYRSN